MFCPTCYPHSSPPDRITKIYAHMSTILVQGKAHFKCNSCGACIPQEQDAAPAPKVSEADLQKSLIDSLRAENADLQQQLRIMTAERDALNVELLRLHSEATYPVVETITTAGEYPSIPAATELPPSHNS